MSGWTLHLSGWICMYVCVFFVLAGPLEGIGRAGPAKVIEKPPPSTIRHGIGPKALCVEPVARQRDMQMRQSSRDINPSLGGSRMRQLQWLGLLGTESLFR